MNESELESEDFWQWKVASPRQPVPDATASVVVRFDAGDFARLTEAAEQAGVSLTAFIAEAALQAAQAAARKR